MNEIDKQWIAFMAHIPHNEQEYILETLKDYDIGKYIIGLEHAESVGEHYHFLVQMTDKDYHKYSKRVFKDKFKLRGQNRGGKCKQYGKLKEIKDLEKMKAYTCKDNKVMTNMSDEEIQKYVEMSYKKEEQLELIDEMAEILNERYINQCIIDYGPEENYETSSHTFHIKHLRMMIIDIMREKNLKSISRTKVENVLYRFLMKKGSPYHATTENIYNVLYGFN